MDSLEGRVQNILMDPSQKGIPQEEAGNVPGCKGSEVSRSQPEHESPVSASIWKFAVREDTER